MRLPSMFLSILAVCGSTKVLRFIGTAFVTKTSFFRQLPLKSMLINRHTTPINIESDSDALYTSLDSMLDFEQHRLIEKNLKYLSTVLVDWEKLPVAARDNFRTQLVENVPKMIKEELVDLLQSLSKLKFQWSSLPRYLQVIIQEFLINHIGTLEPHQIANIALSFADLGANFEDFIPKFRSKLVNKVNNRLRLMSKQDVAKTCFALIALDWRTGENFQALLNSMLSSTRMMDIQQITLSLYALSRVEGKWNEMSLANRMTLLMEIGRIYAADNRLHVDGSAGNSGNVTTLLYALGSLGAKWSDLPINTSTAVLVSLERATQGPSPVLRDRVLAGLVYGLGRMGLRWSALSMDLRASLQRDLSDVSVIAQGGTPSDVVLMLWGLGQMGTPLSALLPPPSSASSTSVTAPVKSSSSSYVVPLLLEAMQEFEWDFSPEEVPQLLQGVALLGLSWDELKPSLKSCIARLVSSHVADFSNEELCDVMQALSLLSFDYNRDTVRVRNFNSLNREVLDVAERRTSLSFDRRQTLQLLHYLETMRCFTFETESIARNILSSSDQWKITANSSVIGTGEVAYGGYDYRTDKQHVSSTVLNDLMQQLKQSLDPAKFKVVKGFQGYPEGAGFPPMDFAVISAAANNTPVVFMELNKEEHFLRPPAHRSNSNSSSYKVRVVRTLQFKDSLYMNRYPTASVRHYSEEVLTDPAEMKKSVDKIVSLCSRWSTSNKKSTEQNTRTD